MGDGAEGRISAMYAVGDAQSDMSLVQDGGGEQDLSHRCNRGRSVHISLVGDVG